jgi:hypothetical protein
LLQPKHTPYAAVPAAINVHVNQYKHLQAHNQTCPSFHSTKQQQTQQLQWQHHTVKVDIANQSTRQPDMIHGQHK